LRSRGGISSRLVRRDSKRPAAGPSESSKTSPVQREDVPLAQFLRQNHERRIGVIHGNVGVFFDQLPGPLQGLTRLGNQRGAASQEIVKYCRGSPWDPRKERHRLCQDRLRCEEFPFELIEESETTRVARI